MKKIKNRRQYICFNEILTRIPTIYLKKIENNGTGTGNKKTCTANHNKLAVWKYRNK